jgi:hypothetical protein
MVEEKKPKPLCQMWSFTYSETHYGYTAPLAKLRVQTMRLKLVVPFVRVLMWKSEGDLELILASLEVEKDEDGTDNH